MGILMLGAGLQGTLLGVRATLEGFPTLVIGAVMAAYYVGYVAGSLVAPSLIHGVGHIRVFAALSSVTCAAILLQSVFLEPAAWAVLRAASGACFAGIFVVAESWLNGRAKSGNRGALLGVYMVVLYLGMGAGQLLLGLADPQSATLFILVAVLISIATVPLALTAQRAPDFTLPRRERMRELLAKSPLGVIGVFVAGALGATFVALGPAYAAILGLEAPAIAAFMSTGIFAATAAQLPLGRWSDRTDRRTVIMSVSTGSGVGRDRRDGGRRRLVVIHGAHRSLYRLVADPLSARGGARQRSSGFIATRSRQQHADLDQRRRRGRRAAGRRDGHAGCGGTGILRLVRPLACWACFLRPLAKDAHQRRVARAQRAVLRRRTAIVADRTAR